MLAIYDFEMKFINDGVSSFRPHSGTPDEYLLSAFEIHLENVNSRYH